VPASVNWHEHVAPIVVGKCAGCHRDGGIGPFPFTDYEAAAPLADAIAVAVQTGTMPPFGADETEECTFPHPLQDDLRLGDDEKQMLQVWADAGAPEGDPALAAPIPMPPSVTLDSADQRIGIDAAVTIDGPNDQFLCFSLDPQLTEDRFLKALQVVPGNPKIVHHVLIYVDEDGSSAEQENADGFFPCSGGSLGGDLVGAWAPGALPNRMPDNAGMYVPAGARLVVNVHFHPTGLGPEVDDSTAIDLDWHETRPVWAAQLALIGNGVGNSLLPGPNDESGPQFRIPAGAEGHTEEMLFTLPADTPEIRFWAVGSHMHYLGQDMLLGVMRAGEPEGECLLQTPRYSFEWQRAYAYDASLDAVPRAQGGDQIYLRCTYDNTLNNPGVAEALQQQGLTEPVDVFLGEETLDEMCLGVFGVAFPNIF
jgi:hypothetical protein